MLLPSTASLPTASCSNSGSDALRRPLSFEELALIARPGAVRQITIVVLEAQRELVGKQITTVELDALVAARSEIAGLELSDEDQAEIVDFLNRLSRAEINRGPFMSGWSTRYSDDGSGVVLTANQDTSAEDPATGIPGAVTEPIGDAFRRWQPPIALAGTLLLLGIFGARRLLGRGR